MGFEPTTPRLKHQLSDHYTAAAHCPPKQYNASEEPPTVGSMQVKETSPSQASQHVLTGSKIVQRSLLYAMKDALLFQACDFAMVGIWWVAVQSFTSLGHEILNILVQLSFTHGILPFVAMESTAQPTFHI